jgi:hypothetical protein
MFTLSSLNREGIVIIERRRDYAYVFVIDEAEEDACVLILREDRLGVNSHCCSSSF